MSMQNRVTKSNRPLGAVVAVLLAFVIPAGWAQEMDPGAMDHSAMDHGNIDHSTMDHGSMDHSTHAAEAAPATPSQATGDGAHHEDHAMPQQDPGKTDQGTAEHGAMDHSTMDHSTMDHSTMDHGATHGSEHGAHGAEQKPAPDTTDHTGHGANHGAAAAGAMTGMDHSAHGESEPAGPRDPHAYSGGYTLSSGPYVLPEHHHLHLADEHNFGSLLMDRLEVAGISGDSDTAAAYDLQAWYGRDFNRAVLKAEGHWEDGELEEAETQLLWSHAIASYWDSQLGLRYDSGEGPDRAWLAAGIQGLAPYWFEVDFTAYVGDEGRTALSAEAEYELLLTQRLILQPRLEAAAYGKSDPQLGLGSGLSELTGGLRLRYEIRREFAPYLGIERSGSFGATADYARESGNETTETRYVAGVRFWF